MAKSRTQNSTRNIVFSATAYLIQIVLGFLVRRYFIYYFNEEFLGLNSLFSNVLNVLSLAEMGVGSAIVFAMYKPMAEGDTKSVRALLDFYKKCYIVIGSIVAVLGMLVFPFMDYFKAKAPQVDVNLYIVYFIFLFNSVISYFCAHRRALLYTDQRQDIESKINILVYLFQYLLQLIIIVCVKNFYLYLLVASVANLLTNMLVFIITNKRYSEIINGEKEQIDLETKKSIKKNVFAMLFHKIGGVVVFGTDSILIYLMIGASELGKYSNYVLITTYVGYIFTIYINAIKGSVGNSIAIRSEEENYKLFNKLNLIHFFITSFCAVCIFVLANPFIDTILTKGDNSLLFNMNVLIIICINFYLSKARDLTNLFKECAGLFYQDRFKPVVESIVNLVSSIIFAKLWGISGVLLGTILSTIVMPLWVEPFVINKYYFKKSTLNYFVRFFYYTACMLVTCVCSHFICSFIPDGNLLWLAVKFVTCAIVTFVLLVVCLFWTPEFKECVKWGKDIFRNMFKKGKVSESLAVVEENGIVEENSLNSGDEIVSNEENENIDG